MALGHHGGCERLPPPSFVPFSSSSQSSVHPKWHRQQGDNSHPLFPVHPPAAMAWAHKTGVAAFPVPKQPSLSQAHLKQENLITKAHGAELSTPSIHRAWDKHGNQGSTTHAKPAGLCKVFQDPCAHTVFMQVQAPLAPILRDYTYQIVQ